MYVAVAKFPGFPAVVPFLRSCKTLLEGAAQAEAQAYASRPKSVIDEFVDEDLYDGLLSCTACCLLAESGCALLKPS